MIIDTHIGVGDVFKSTCRKYTYNEDIIELKVISIKIFITDNEPSISYSCLPNDEKYNNYLPLTYFEEEIIKSLTK